MKMMILAGKGITLFAWGVMLYNLFFPIEGNVGTLLSILLAITLVMHSFQVLIFHMLFKSLMVIKKSHYFAVLLFGVFSLLAYRQRLLATQ
jgi:putative membrane protein